MAGLACAFASALAAIAGGPMDPRYMLCYGTESVAVAVFELLPDDAVMVMV